MKEEDLGRLFPSDAKMREEARTEREKLGITLEGAAWVVKKLAEHMKAPGTYRYLIYERMGFGQEAYCEFLEAGLMEVHNHLCDYHPDKEEGFQIHSES